MGKKYAAYEWFKARVNDGVLSFRYRIKGGKVDGSERHDEDVSEWTEQEIKQLAVDLFEIDPAKVEVEYL